MKLKLIQVGLGAMGTKVGEDFVLPSPDFEHVGLVDINKEQVEECSKLFKVPQNQCYADYEQAFKELKADAVLIEALSPIHYKVCKAALKYNLHVLVEKPFVTKLEEAQELVAEAESKNLVIMINQNYRYLNIVNTFKSAIKSRKMGEALFANVEFYMNHIGKSYQCEMKDVMLLEMAIHHIDMMRYIFDSDVYRTRGKTWNSPNSMFKGDPNVQALFEMNTNIPISYIGSLVSKGKSTPWEGVWRVQCEEGSIHLADLGEGFGVYIVNADKKPRKLEIDTNTLDDIHGSLSEFASSIRHGNEPLSSGKDNLYTLATLFATSQSSKDVLPKYPEDFM